MSDDVSIRDQMQEIASAQESEAAGPVSDVPGRVLDQSADATPAPEQGAVASSVPVAGEGHREAEARAERARDEKGRFAPGSKDATKPQAQEAKDTVAPPAKAPADGVAPAPVGTNPPGADAGQPSQSSTKPPNGWRPAAKEQWAKLPPEVHAEVTRREKEIEGALTETVKARKNWAALEQTLAPYEMLFRSTGTHPLQAIDGYFKTEVALRTGTPHQKAQIVAGLVKSYGIDIEALDGALSQTPQPHAQAQSQTLDPEAIIRQAEERVLQRFNAQRQQAIQQKVTGEIESFGQQREFFENVRDEMSDLLSLAAQRGKQMSLEQAYEKACALDPEISAILAQRRAATAANAQAASTQRARTAAVSLKSHPAGSSPQSDPTDIREQLAAAAARHAGR